MSVQIFVASDCDTHPVPWTGAPPGVPRDDGDGEREAGDDEPHATTAAAITAAPTTPSARRPLDTAGMTALSPAAVSLPQFLCARRERTNAIGYRGAVRPLGRLVRSASAFRADGGVPTPLGGAAIVTGSGCVAALIGVGTAILDGSGRGGLVTSLLLPLLFLAYWGVQAWLVDAGAGMLGRAGRRRAFLGASGYAFLTWIAYSVLALGEAATTRSGANALAATLTWLTLPVLLWFLAMTVRAVRAVYDIPLLNAFALALLPYAAVAGALLVVGAAAGALHG